ncbi:MAG: hypothetical protein GX144_12875 [Clostridiaceae bacterium]|jgi:hypothetical protein|nr:hypothetical protein [Clostridiaceae bacterium]
MDNKVSSQIKRGLKITGDYFISLVIFAIFSSLVFTLAKNNIEKGIFIFSIIMFIVLFSMIYSGMSDVAFREKRPQYKINPPPYKGFLYGLIGALPVFILQLLYYIVRVDELYLIAKRRALQFLTGPFYWLASLISKEVWSYHLVLLLIPVIAGLGYMAGYHDFYIMRRLKIFKNLTKRNKNTEKK